MARKLLLIFASLTLVIAGGALYFALAQNPTATAASVSGPTRPVLIATGDLPPGTKGAALTDSSVTTVQMPTNLVAANTLTSLSQVVNLQAVVPIFKGQILMNPMFGTSLNTGGLAIPPGTNAVTVSISDTGRVAGFVQPGSRVVVYDTSSEGGGKVLLQSAQIIAIGPTTATGTASGAVSNKSASTALVTFALTPKDAIAIVGKDSLSLGLLPS